MSEKSRQVWSVTEETEAAHFQALHHHSRVEALNIIAPRIVTERLDLVRALCKERFLKVMGTNATVAERRYVEQLLCQMFPGVKP